MVRAAHLDLDHIALGPQLTVALGLPVRVANDAHAAALGELAFVPSESGNVLLVRIAEGIGAGLVINHQLFTGTAHAAGEIGHVVVNPRGELCACGKRGCLETVVTTPLAAARDGRLDRKVVTDAGRHLGTALAHLVSALNIDSVVVSGSDEVLGETFRDAARDAIRRRTLDDLGASVELRPSTFGARRRAARCRRADSRSGARRRLTSSNQLRPPTRQGTHPGGALECFNQACRGIARTPPRRPCRVARAAPGAGPSTPA